MNTGIVILKYKYNSYILYSQFSLSLFSSYNIYIYIFFFLIYYNFKCVFMLKKASFYRKREKSRQVRRKKSSNICTHVN